LITKLNTFSSAVNSGIMITDLYWIWVCGRNLLLS